MLAFGLPREAVGALFKSATERIRDGHSFAAEQPYSGLGDFPVAFRPVLPCWYEPFAATGVWFYGGSDFPLLQLFWPNDDGKMPWEPTRDWRRGRQPQLFHDNAIAARVEALLASVVQSTS